MRRDAGEEGRHEFSSKMPRTMSNLPDFPRRPFLYVHLCVNTKSMQGDHQVHVDVGEVLLRYRDGLDHYRWLPCHFVSGAGLAALDPAVDVPGHTTLAAMTRLVALVPGCSISWKVANAGQQWFRGMTGQGVLLRGVTEHSDGSKRDQL